MAEVIHHSSVRTHGSGTDGGTMETGTCDETDLVRASETCLPLTIRDIPLDAWVIVLKFINPELLVQTFHNLFYSTALNIPERYKMDAFWIVVAEARHAADRSMLVNSREDFLCDLHLYHSCRDTLIEMGVHSENATRLARDSNGSLDAAFSILGWG